jgi:MEDS: MEthanogen/methylotroph, DcmR Sensory domain
LPAIEAVLWGKRFVSRGLEFSEGADTQAPHHHDVLFCSDDAALLDGLTGFIGKALNVGDAAIVWATESHRASLLQRLRAQGTDIEADIRRGTCILLDAAEKPDPVRMLVAIGGLSEAASKAGKKLPPVAVCGERAGRFWAEGRVGETIRLELLLNELAKHHDIEILCP